MAQMLVMHYTVPMTNTQKPQSPAQVAANHSARLVREANTPVYTTTTPKGK